MKPQRGSPGASANGKPLLINVYSKLKLAERRGGYVYADSAMEGVAVLARVARGDRSASRRVRAVGLCAAVLFVVALAAPALAAEAWPPHVAQGDDTDTCAMCHRVHTAASETTWSDTLGTEHNALIVGAFPAEVGDTELCFTCHGWAGVGAESVVQEDFEKLSYHRIAPEESEYGPSPKDCGDCHDSHGTAKTDVGTPYPALLRAMESSTSGVYQGPEYCATCHPDRPTDVWSGIEIWRQTAHAGVPTPSTGTEVVCSACHAPHGSGNTALIVEELLPPSAPATTTVAANDRTFCFVCHPIASATYPGEATYQTSTHGSSEETVAVVTEWGERLHPSEETTRVIGECQVCHAPMGTDDGDGAPIAKMANAEGAELCYRCHNGSTPLAADIESVYPTTTADVPEVITAYGATAATAQFGLVQVYSRESSTAVTLPTPRQAIEGTVGPMVAGDIDGDANDEVLVARRGTTGLSIIEQSPLAGVSSVTANLLEEAQYVAIGDVLNDGSPAEIIAATGNVIRAYHWDGANLTFVPSSAITVTGTISGLTTGDVLGTAHGEIVVTTQTPSQLYVIDGGSGSLVVGGPYSLGGAARLPRGPSTGDLDGNGKGEIAVAFGNARIIEIRNAAGGLVTTSPTGGSAGQTRGQRTLITDVLWGTQAAGRSGAEVVVTYSVGTQSAQDPSVDVFTQTAAGGLAGPIRHTLPDNTFPAEMAAGDVDGDGRDELLVARAGSLVSWLAPGIHIVQPNAAGTGLVAISVFEPAAGVEAADSGPGPAWVAYADLGDVGLSRHAVDAVPRTHISTETAYFSRHVDCVDCHNVHEATSTASAAPAAYGSIKGTWGVSAQFAPANQITLTEKQGVEFEYELCLKCHSAWSASPDTRDIASEIDTRNASVHAIAGPSTTSQATAGSFVAPWGNNSVLHCIDCHGNADTASPLGPHASPQTPLLLKPYWGVAPARTDHLCYDCHRYDVYYTGTADVSVATRSLFRNGATRLHREHGLIRGRSCAACHVSHGGRVERLLRSDIGYARAGNVVTCTNGCHGTTPARSYTRP